MRPSPKERLSIMGSLQSAIATFTLQLKMKRCINKSLWLSTIICSCQCTWKTSNCLLVHEMGEPHAKGGGSIGTKREQFHTHLDKNHHSHSISTNTLNYVGFHGQRGSLNPWIATTHCGHFTIEIYIATVGVVLKKVVQK